MESLQERIIEHLEDQQGDLDAIEIENTVELVNTYSSDMYNLSEIDATIITRLCSDDKLINEINISSEHTTASFNPFD